MRDFRLFGVIRRVAGLAGFVLFSLPASAQSSFLSAVPVRPGTQPALSAAMPVEPSVVPGAFRVSFFAEHPAALQPLLAETKSQSLQTLRTPLAIVAGTAGDPSIAVRMAATLEEMRTPFLKQVRVPLISIWSGRVQLSGFRSVSAPGGSLVPQRQPGVRVPGNNRSYGLSLRVRFSKQDADRAGNGLWSAARQATSWGRAFLTL